MQATTRLGMPQTSFDGAATVNANSPDEDKNKPSAEMEQGVLTVAKQLTRYGDFANFTDDELTDKSLPYLRALNVKCKDKTSSVRRVRKWLSEQPKSEIVLVEGVRRNNSRVWKWQPWREPVAEAVGIKTQKGLFDESM
jgi:hypothetical protein